MALGSGHKLGKIEGNSREMEKNEGIKRINMITDKKKLAIIIIEIFFFNFTIEKFPFVDFSGRHYLGDDFILFSFYLPHIPLQNIQFKFNLRV